MSTTMLRAIHIDPFTKTIREVEVATNAEGDADYEALRSFVFQGRERGYIELSNLGGDHCIVIDEEGVLCDWDTQAFFSLGRRESAATFAGHGLLMRKTDDGCLTDSTLPLSLVQSLCTWLDPREVTIPAPVLQTVAPDGTVELEYLAGTECWDYENQP
jgi:hypothetical protein